jgi:hypothetical protein
LNEQKWDVGSFLYLLIRVTTDEWLPDGSEKPGEALWVWVVPDLKRTAGTKDDINYCC